MNTYRVYALDVTEALAPVVHVCYIRADKYGPAWQGARAALDADKAKTAPDLFADQACTSLADVSPGKHVTVARIDDLKPRNVKLDKAALQAILADDDASAEDKLAAMRELLGA